MYLIIMKGGRKMEFVKISDLSMATKSTNHGCDINCSKGCSNNCGTNTGCNLNCGCAGS